MIQPTWCMKRGEIGAGDGLDLDLDCFGGGTYPLSLLLTPVSLSILWAATPFVAIGLTPTQSIN